MNLVLTTTNNQTTTTSLQLVEYINYLRKQENEFDYSELRHDNFLSKVKEVLKGGELKFKGSYKSLQNKELLMYVFPQREAMLMAMSYSYDVQAKIYDAWKEAENKLNGVVAIPTNFSEALKLAYEQSVVIETQKLQLTAASTVIEEMKPAQTFVENFVRNNKSMTLTQAWKGLGLQPNKFNKRLREDGILCSAGSATNAAKQQYLLAGYFSTKYTEFGSQTLVQPKGIIYIAKKYAEYIEQHSVN